MKWRRRDNQLPSSTRFSCRKGTLKTGFLACAVLATTLISAQVAANDTLVAVKVKLEGAVSGATPPAMRTDLWTRNLLDTIQNPTSIPQTPCFDGSSEQIDESIFPIISAKPVDWVCVELREVSTPHVVSASFIGVLMSDGFIVLSDRNWPIVTVDPNMEYHVVVHHKSHLAVASLAKQPFQGSPNNVLFHDFTMQGSGPFVGSNQKLINGEYVMLAGDASQDNFIDGSDINFWRNGNGYWQVYRPHDVNLDGDINGADKTFISSNSGAFFYIP